MIRLMTIGLISGFFFSTTFVLNHMMSLGGGHWFWSGALRYGYMLFLLGGWITVTRGFSFLQVTLKELRQNLFFWIISGSIGFGAFYALICFSADHSPGWVVATTWQLTIIASLFILLGFGRRFPKKIWAWALVVFGGVCLVNLGHFEASNLKSLLLGAIPVLVAAFCYPLGNQLVWEAKTGRKGVPKIDGLVLDNPFAKVFLLSAGSIPFWGGLYLFSNPGSPSPGQWVNTALVAILSGVVATSLFLYARGKADTPAKLAAVDATQCSEVVFALAGEVLFLGAALPNAIGITGIIITGMGLIAFARSSQ
ncbi:MAG: multidrug resistance efflux transporter family protein [Desulfobacteraceae bacterium]|nr:multidrug resistance efflux transporter family protein [Desulfobacteraceae bacterium]